MLAVLHGVRACTHLHVPGGSEESTYSLYCSSHENITSDSQEERKKVKERQRDRETDPEKRDFSMIMIESRII